MGEACHFPNAHTKRLIFRSLTAKRILKSTLRTPEGREQKNWHVVRLFLITNAYFCSPDPPHTHFADLPSLKCFWLTPVKRFWLTPHPPRCFGGPTQMCVFPNFDPSQNSRTLPSQHLFEGGNETPGTSWC